MISCINWQAISSLAIILGVVVAITSIFQARKTAKHKAAIDWINSNHMDAMLSSSLHTIVSLHHDPLDEIEKIAYMMPNDKGFQKAKHLFYALNSYEYLAVGIKHHIYDERAIKQACYTNVIMMWDMCEPFVLKRRIITKQKTLFMEIEWLAKRWEAKPLKKH